MMLELFPLIFADRRLPISTHLYASDASKLGGGVVYSDVDDVCAVISSLSETRVRQGWTSPLRPLSPSAEHPADVLAVPPAPSHVSSSFAQVLGALNFKTAISHRCMFKNVHINLLEEKAALLGVRHMLRSPLTRNHRVDLPIDSTSNCIGRSCERMFFLVAPQHPVPSYRIDRDTREFHPSFTLGAFLA